MGKIMTKVINPEIIKVIYVVWYKTRFLSIYAIIGIISIILEVNLREYLIKYDINKFSFTKILSDILEVNNLE